MEATNLADIEWWVRFIWVPFTVAGVGLLWKMYVSIQEAIRGVNKHVDDMSQHIREEMRAETKVIHDRVDQVDRDLQTHKVDVARNYVQVNRLSEMEARLTKRLEEISGFVRQMFETKVNK